jgi:hypothetical protein
VGADLIDFPSYSTGSTFADPGLHLPVDVPEWVEFKGIWQTIRSVSLGNELIFAAVSQTSSLEF